jgi:hypothetical protein
MLQPCSCSKVLVLMCLVTLCIRFMYVTIHDSFKHAPSYIIQSSINVNAYGAQCALVLTPYNIIPGGGENYLLRSLRLLQLNGYQVDLMVTEGNSCNNINCLERTSTQLRIYLDIKSINFLVASIHGGVVPVRDEVVYSVFFLIGKAIELGILYFGCRGMRSIAFP